MYARLSQLWDRDKHIAKNQPCSCGKCYSCSMGEDPNLSGSLGPLVAVAQGESTESQVYVRFAALAGLV